MGRVAWRSSERSQRVKSMDEEYQKGIQYLEAGKMREAEESFLKCLSENPENAWIHNKLGLVYAKVENYDRAKEHFHLALQMDPKLAHAWNNLGNIARQEGDLEQARTYYKEAAAVEPENTIPQRNLRVVEKQLKWTPGLFQLFRRNKSGKS